jgi:hypothetical protein
VHTATEAAHSGGDKTDDKTAAADSAERSCEQTASSTGDTAAETKPDSFSAAASIKITGDSGSSEVSAMADEGCAKASEETREAIIDGEGAQTAVLLQLHCIACMLVSLKLGPYEYHCTSDSSWQCNTEHHFNLCARRC